MKRVSTVAAMTVAEMARMPKASGNRTLPPVREAANAVPADPDVIFRAATQMKTWRRTVRGACSVRAARVEAKKKALRAPVSAYGAERADGVHVELLGVQRRNQLVKLAVYEDRPAAHFLCQRLRHLAGEAGTSPTTVLSEIGGRSTTMPNLMSAMPTPNRRVLGLIRAMPRAREAHSGPGCAAPEG